MKRKRDLYLCMTCLLLAFLFTMAANRAHDEAMAARIAPEILRFHVLANSDSKEDQQLKLEVRTLLLDSIYEALGEDATLDETKAYVEINLSSLEQEAEVYMKSQGYDYPAHMEVTDCYFPTKTYGDMVFPCGTYEAVRVKIGSGRGHNWWCVLYPPLCFVDSTYAVVPDKSKSLLEASLDAADYQAICRENCGRKINVKFKMIEMLKNRENRETVR